MGAQLLGELVLNGLSCFGEARFVDAIDQLRKEQSHQLSVASDIAYKRDENLHNTVRYLGEVD